MIGYDNRKFKEFFANNGKSNQRNKEENANNKMWRIINIVPYCETNPIYFFGDNIPNNVEPNSWYQNFHLVLYL